MGINVCNKVVQIDDTHNWGVNTSVNDNPTISNVGNITIHQIFSRNKGHKRSKDDGNPLIYAMKGLYQYTITPADRIFLMNRASQIVAGLTKSLRFDCILHAPSSNAFAGEIANMIMGMTSVSILSCDFIRKKNMGELIAQYGSGISNLKPSHKSEYKHLMGVWRDANPDKLVSMKSVDTKIRTYIEPMILDGNSPNLMGKRVLIVDDLMASGSTIGSIAGIVTQLGAKEVTGLCFLSKLR